MLERQKQHSTAYFLPDPAVSQLSCNSGRPKQWQHHRESLRSELSYRIPPVSESSCEGVAALALYTRTSRTTHNLQSAACALYACVHCVPAHHAPTCWTTGQGTKRRMVAMRHTSSFRQAQAHKHATNKFNMRLRTCQLTCWDILCTG